MMRYNQAGTHSAARAVGVGASGSGKSGKSAKTAATRSSIAPGEMHHLCLYDNDETKTGRRQSLLVSVFSLLPRAWSACAHKFSSPEWVAKSISIATHRLRTPANRRNLKHPPAICRICQIMHRHPRGIALLRGQKSSARMCGLSRCFLV
jgi:hypothetical protein